MAITRSSIRSPPRGLCISGQRSQLQRRPPSPPPLASSLAAAVTSDQRRALERLSEYPNRVERLRLLWADSQRTTSLSLSRGSAATSSRVAQSGGGGSRAPGGPLTQSQIRDLMSREISPEDYELLLLLDEGLNKAKTLAPEIAAALPRATGSAWLNEECSICLCALEADEDVRRMPACGHLFHAPCAQRWLTSSKATCPLCGQAQERQQRVIEAFRRFDENGDGQFDAVEMKRVLTALDPKVWQAEHVDQLFTEIDVNSDGRIDVEDFVNWVFAADSGCEQQTFCDVMNI